MWKLPFLAFVWLVIHGAAYGQPSERDSKPGLTQSAPTDEMPVVRARSRNVTFIDGLHSRENYWYITPESQNPDPYYVEIPLLAHDVTIVTDLESLTLPMTYRMRRPFRILFEDGTEVRREILADFNELLSYRRADSTSSNSTDRIPFTIGDNDKIYLRGRINDGVTLNIQFDLGAGGTILNRSSISKIAASFDDTITFQNSSGVHEAPLSRNNRLEIEGLIWSGVDVAVADNLTHREDLIVGNSLFRDKVVEIDYDQMTLIIHSTLPELSSDWHREEIILDGGTVPFVRGKLIVGESVQDGWFMLDTGAYTSILYPGQLHRFSKFGYELTRVARPPVQGAIGPEIHIGGMVFTDTNYSVHSQKRDDDRIGLLGNDILKRFNLVLDNRNGVAYFRPNRHVDDSYRNPERIALRFAGVVLVLFAAALIWLRKRRLQKQAVKTSPHATST